VWTRVFGYDMAARHGAGPLRGAFLSQLDVPRMLDAGMVGGVFSIATNPFRRRARRTPTTLANVARLVATLDGDPARQVVWDHAGYVRARAGGRLACFVGIQGGNGLDTEPGDVERAPEEVSRITLVHLSRSTLGTSSAPAGRTGGGLTPFGLDFVSAMNRRRILVDLAHASRASFWDALAVHDRSQPAIVSHTGVSAIHPSWRNVDDDQLLAIAELGGVVGVMFHSGFLGDGYLSGSAATVARHVRHVVQVAGEDTAAVGSDWDGMIVPPRDMRTVDRLPVLVQALLDAGLSPPQVQKVLGLNYLRVVSQIRPG
jgi:membrane dipeptidase